MTTHDAQPFHLPHSFRRALRRVIGFVVGVMCAAALGGSPAFGAQEVQVSASLDSTQITVGDTATLSLEITGVDPNAAPSPPPAPVVNGLDIQYTGASRSTGMVVIINGQRQTMGDSKVTYEYAVTPRQRGRFIIPAMSVDVGGRAIATSPLTVTAADPPEAAGVRVTVEPAKTEVYAGEPVDVVMTLFFDDRIRTARFATGPIPDGVKIYPSVSPEEKTARRMLDINLNGSAVRGALGSREVDEQMWHTVSIAFTIIAHDAGTVTLTAPSAIMDVATGRRGSGIFSNDLTERQIAKADPIRLTVKPVPVAGRPRDFTGLVGRYDVRAQAAPTSVHVGEPINVAISITGPRPLEIVDPPDLAADEDFASGFKVSPEGWTETTAAGAGGPTRERSFKTTIRVASESVSEIPSIGFSYFDPEREQFRRAASKAMPLEVLETKQITAADAIGGSGGANGNGFLLPEVEHVPIESAAAPGVAFAPMPATLRSQHLLMTDELRNPGVAAAIAVPPVALGVCAVMAVRRRTHDPGAARRRGALRAALRRVGDSPTPERAADAVRVFIADRFGMSASTVTAHDARRLIGPRDAELGDEAARVILAGDGARFAEGREMAARPAIDVRALVRRMDEATA